MQMEIALSEVLPGEKVETMTEFTMHAPREKAEAVYIGIEDSMTNHTAVKLSSSQE